MTITHISDDPKFRQWRQALVAEGVTAFIQGEGKISNTAHANVYFVCFHGDGFQPAHLTAMIHWYGEKNGFAVYLMSPEGEFQKEAKLIAGKPETGEFPTAEPKTDQGMD